MNDVVLEVTDVAKRYRLGVIGAKSLREEFSALVDRTRGKLPAVQSSEFWALRDISFSVNKGEVLGIVGRNGAGKSTLLKILSGITEPTSGEIRLKGRLGSLLEVGTGFHPELSGRDNIFLNGAILGMRRAEIARKLDEIVAFSEIDEFIDTPVKRYSSGMYVRLAFAVAAHLEPEILILDEVLAVGDADFQRKCLGKMESISHDSHRTILFVSHNMAAIRRLCTRCVLLERGMPSRMMTVDEAIDLYATRQMSSNSTVELGDRERREARQGRKARLQSVAIVEGEAFVYGYPGWIEVAFDLQSPAKGIVASVSFNTLEGQKLLTLDSDTGCQAWSLSEGRHVARIGLDFWPLHPGPYSVDVAIFQASTPLDVLTGAAVWETRTSSVDNVSDRGFGAVRLPPLTKIS